MEEKRYDFIITNHVRERFVERFSADNRKVYAHLRTCRGCPRCVSLAFRLKREVDSSRHFLDKMICARLHEAHETRIHHNNHDFMTRMAAKYDKPAHYLISDDILFLVVDSEEGKVCVTCMDAKDSVLGDFVRRPKFRKKVPAMAN